MKTTFVYYADPAILGLQHTQRKQKNKAGLKIAGTIKSPTR